MADKPDLKLSIDWSLQQGTAIAYDKDGRAIATLNVPHEKPPPETRLMRMSVEDYMAAMRSLGAFS